MSSVRVTVETASKALVDSLLDMNTNNRRIRQGIVDMYRRDIESGRWILTNQGIGVSRDEVLVDGQHRLMAIREAGYPPVQFLLATGLDPEASMAVDVHAKRSMRDLMHFAFDTRVSAKAPAICRNILKTKLGDGEKTVNVWTPNEIMDTMIEYSDSIEAVVSAPINAGFYSAAHMTGFVLALQETTKEYDVVRFMRQVESGDMLEKDKPAYHLRNFIVLTKRNAGGGTLASERLQKTYKATMAYLNGESMRILRLK